MSRFNKRPVAAPVTSPIVTRSYATLRTGNNAPGFERDAKSELFLLAVSNFVGQNMAYESGRERDLRFNNLVAEVTRLDFDWIKRFLPWLRGEANMRTASLIAAVEAVRVLTEMKIPGGRQLVDSVLQRADEPGEMIGYWKAFYPGKQIPKPIKRGIADAVRRLYTEYNSLKYDTASHAVRFGDVLELTHPEPSAWNQGNLFRWLIDRRHGRSDLDVRHLPMVHQNQIVRHALASSADLRFLRPDVFKAAGMTWEDVLSLAGDRFPKKDLWEAMIPNMGYMALLRNLRNFDQAKIDQYSVHSVTEVLTNSAQVAKSRQLPMRFLSAYRAIQSNLRWAFPLEVALEYSLQNVPEFPGRTLILIDTSGSMTARFSTYSDLMLWDAAAMFGLAVAKRCQDATVVSFSGSSKEFVEHRTAGASLLRLVERFGSGFFYGGGTNTVGAVGAHYKGHDRVLILTDEQANHHNYIDVTASIPQEIPVITFNLAGYQAGHMKAGSGTRVTIGGLSDQALKLLPILEGRMSGQWPF